MKKYILLPLCASSLLSASSVLHVTPDDLQEHIDNKNKTILQAYITHPKQYLFTDLDTSANILQKALRAREVTPSEDTKQASTLEKTIKLLPKELKIAFTANHKLYEITKNLLNTNQTYQNLLEECFIFPSLTWENIAHVIQSLTQAREKYFVLTNTNSSKQLTNLETYLKNSEEFLSSMLEYMTENVDMTLQDVQRFTPVIKHYFRTYQGSVYRSTTRNHVKNALHKAAQNIAPRTYKDFIELEKQITKTETEIDDIRYIRIEGAEKRFETAKNLCQLFIQCKELIEKLLALPNRQLFFNIDAFKICAEFNNTDRSSSLKTNTARQMQLLIFGSDWNMGVPVSPSTFATNHYAELLHIIETVNHIMTEVLQDPAFELDKGKERLYFVYNPESFYIINNAQNLIAFLQKMINNPNAKATTLPARTTKPDAIPGHQSYNFGNIGIETADLSFLYPQDEAPTPPARTTKPATASQKKTPRTAAQPTQSAQLTQKQMQEQLRIEQEKIRIVQELTADLKEMQRLFEEKEADSLEQLPKILNLFEKMYNLTHDPVDPSTKEQLVQAYNQAVRKAFDKAHQETLLMKIKETAYIKTLKKNALKQQAAQKFNAKMQALSDLMQSKKRLFINPNLSDKEFMQKTDPKQFLITV